ncbi:SMI1/KNR4 family protein [Lentzea sp.]|uniref:SMI1/KNR4 family protein n=1 Tax=Lentzea sp. TaxID=56099 RepID=UPI002C419A18|nr:SMI1/KNR4 family protein [Lentzea sp.]HUQ54884.1 SMI1/KNR4 family protein [Lentzea sp.]
MTQNGLQPWERIHNWLRVNASRTFGQITAGPDATDFWRLAGAENLIPARYTPLSFEDSGRERSRKRTDLEVEAEPAGTTSGIFLGEFVPIAANGMGDYLFVDERPGPESGCVREWDVDEGSRLPTLWPSPHAMLTDIARSLDTGEPALRGHADAAEAKFFRVSVYVPEVHDARLSWQRLPT